MPPPPRSNSAPPKHCPRNPRPAFLRPCSFLAAGTHYPGVASAIGLEIDKDKVLKARANLKKAFEQWPLNEVPVSRRPKILLRDITKVELSSDRAGNRPGPLSVASCCSPQGLCCVAARRYACKD